MFVNITSYYHHDVIYYCDDGNIFRYTQPIRWYISNMPVSWTVGQSLLLMLYLSAAKHVESKNEK